MNEKQGDTILLRALIAQVGGGKRKQRYKYLHQKSEWEDTDGGWAANVPWEPSGKGECAPCTSGGGVDKGEKTEAVAGRGSLGSQVPGAGRQGRRTSTPCGELQASRGPDLPTGGHHYRLGGGRRRAVP